MNDTTNFHVKIQSREKIIFEANVLSLTSYNEKGKFDVLPMHSNFISLIIKEIVIKDMQSLEKRFDIDVALMRVVSNSVEIYLGIGNGLAEEE
jgi:F0F1-type ATP synthase epsilon subunit